VTFLGQRKQKFELVDQEDLHGFRAANTTIPPDKIQKGVPASEF
jgi:hypothetical protein